MNLHQLAFNTGRKLSEKVDVSEGKIHIMREMLKSGRLTDFKGEMLRYFIDAQEEIPEKFYLNFDAELGYCFLSGLYKPSKETEEVS